MCLVSNTNLKNRTIVDDCADGITRLNYSTARRISCVHILSCIRVLGTGQAIWMMAMPRRDQRKEPRRRLNYSPKVSCGHSKIKAYTYLSTR